MKMHIPAFTVVILSLTWGAGFSSSPSSEITEILIGLKYGFGPDDLVSINVDALNRGC